MWLVSVLVLVPVFYVLSGRQLPDAAVEQLEVFFPKDVAPSEQLLALGCIAGAFIAASPLHKIVRYRPTVVHELGHAFTAGALGGRPKNITISLDTSGLAMYEPPMNWGKVRGTLVSLAGYPASSIAALAAVMATQDGHPQGVFGTDVEIGAQGWKRGKELGIGTGSLIRGNAAFGWSGRWLRPDGRTGPTPASLGHEPGLASPGGGQMLRSHHLQPSSPAALSITSTWPGAG